MPAESQYWPIAVIVCKYFSCSGIQKAAVNNDKKPIEVSILKLVI